MIGRQLIVIVTVFFISKLTSFPSMPMFLPKLLHHILISTGLPGVMVTLTFAQMSPQLVADEYTLRFLDLPGCVSFVILSMWIESVGIFTNFSWLVAAVLEKNFRSVILDSSLSLTNSKATEIDVSMSSSSALVVTDESLPSTTGSSDTEQHYAFKVLSTAFSYLKHFLSILVYVTAAFIVFYGIVSRRSLLPLHPAILLALLLIAYTALFYLEGLQIAVISAQHVTEDEISPAMKRAQLLHSYLTHKHDNVKRFLIGRQFLVIFTVFTIANITTFDGFPRRHVLEYVISMAAHWGVAGILLTLNTVQMPSQMLAKRFAVAFVNLPGAYSLVRVAVAVETVGITHCGWLCFAAVKLLLSM